MNYKKILIWVLSLLILVLLIAIVYMLPPVQSRIAWRLESLQSKIHYYLNPPDQIVFNLPPTAINDGSEVIKEKIEPLHPDSATQTPHLFVTSTPEILSTPTATSTPIPNSVILSGVIHEYQTFNNCGPANLAMLLSYWGWQGDQRDTKAILRPNEDDANVMPQEMVKFIEDQTDLSAILRFGGNIDLLKHFIAAGFPVIVEMGHHPSNDWWMGHYLTVTGYDDNSGVFITQDSLIMPDLPITYQEMEQSWWRDFNYVYLLAYPPERENEIEYILGSDFDTNQNFINTLQKANLEVGTLFNRDLFFALFNQAELLSKTARETEAAEVFDQALSQYNALDSDQRPWRVFWYRDEIYQAYYKAGRYQTVIDLANSTLSMLSKRGLEESHYWRGMAFEALGELDKAKFDYEIALQLRPTYQEAIEALDRIQ